MNVTQTFISSGLEPHAASGAATRFARRYGISYEAAVTDMSCAAWIIGRGQPVELGRAWKYAAQVRRRRGAYADTGGGTGETAVARVAAAHADPLDQLTGDGLERWRYKEVASGTELHCGALRQGARALARAEGISVSAAQRRLNRYRRQIGQLELF